MLDIKKLSEEIKADPISPLIVCFLVYGSCLRKENPPDADICVVIKDNSFDYPAVLKFIYKNFKNPDITIYRESEIISSLPFSDIGNGVFSLEYLSRATALFGENVFAEKLKKTDPELIRESELHKLYQYILRIRRDTFAINNSEEKLSYLNKYTTRLMRMFLLYTEALTYDNIDLFTKRELLTLGQLLGFIHPNIELSENISLETWLDIFTNLEKAYLKINTPSRIKAAISYLKTFTSKSGDIYYLLGSSKAFLPGDTEQLVNICNKGEVYAKLFKYRLNKHPYTTDSAFSFIAWFREGWRTSEYFPFLVRDSGGTIRGSCEIKSAARDSAEIGYWIQDGYPGVMSVAVEKMIKFAEEMGYRKLTARVKEENDTSITFLKKIGFDTQNKYTREDGIVEYEFFLEI